MASGQLYCGDNLEVLDQLIVPESVDLIYLDPPFNSQRTYNIVYKDSRAQEEAFKDSWSWAESAASYDRLLGDARAPKPLRILLRALHDVLVDTDPDQLAYIVMMTARLVALHRALKTTGSLYLHCDPTASHYLKLVLDAVFGSHGFQNEIIWQRAGAKNDAGRYGRSHDTLLFYSRGERLTWNQQFTPFEDHSVVKNYTAVDESGRRYRLSDLTAHKPGGDTDYEWHGKLPYNGRHWAFSRENMDRMLAEGRIVFRRTGMPVYKRYLDEMPGVPVHDVWTDIKQLASASPERLGYPTQKPVSLLERVIASSSNPGDLVLDPFAGCGTTIDACERLGRRWIGIDIARKAVEVIETRLARAGYAAPEVVWHPADLDAARALAERDKTQFEQWVRRKVRAVRLRKKDRGIDGEAHFRDANGGMHHAIVSVKGGKLKPADVRDLRGTLEREAATVGVLVVAQEPSKEMLHEAARAGFLSMRDAEGPIPRVQIVGLERLFSDLPPIRCLGTNVTEVPRPAGPTPPAPTEAQLALDLEPPKAKGPAVRRAKASPPASERRVGRKRGA